MKVLLFNGSIHKEGTTYTALKEIVDTLQQEGIESEIVWIGAQPVQDCIVCGKCRELHRCVIEGDGVNAFLEKAKTADGFVFGTPVYYAHACGRAISAMDRMFYAGKQYFEKKPASVVAVARRAGCTSSYDDLIKHLTIAEMPVVSSTYWNNVFGSNGVDAKQDLEGMQTMRNLARNLSWILKCIQAGKAAGIEPPAAEKSAHTNFIK